MGISVIMASYLEGYKKFRNNPEDKFIRAVRSFQNQTLNNKELIIVSDGCEITNSLYVVYFKDDPNIKLIRCEKSNHNWPGQLREVGRSLSKYNWITYLDADDIFLDRHLEKIQKKIDQLDESKKVIFNTHHLMPMPNNPTDLHIKVLGGVEIYERFKKKSIAYLNDIELTLVPFGNNRHLGTWQITHHKYVQARWCNSNNTGEDTDFIRRLKELEKWEEYIGEYVICHIGNSDNVVWDI